MAWISEKIALISAERSRLPRLETYFPKVDSGINEGAITQIRSIIYFLDCATNVCKVYSLPKHTSSQLVFLSVSVLTVAISQFWDGMLIPAGGLKLEISENNPPLLLP